ncbi:serine protease [Microbaculum marinum]|uniref:Serine protease n=1 Tax=Microbaculum marinum TaxID=1764581 RepID=A0AAW9RWB1_9HYPH
MKTLITGVMLGFALLAAPLAASAQSMHTAMSDDGKDLRVSEKRGNGRLSESNKGSTGYSGIAAALEQRLPTSEIAAIRALEPIGPESIIGADTRKQVNNTRKYPYRAVTLITFEEGRCTGWMVSPRLVVTAGHCVYDPGVGYYSKSSFRVYPGYTGTTAPYGSCRAKRLFTVAGWANSGRDDYDYGAIKLKCKVGNKTGWFGYFWKKGSLKRLPTKIAGYPGDKPLTQWYSRGRVTVSQPRRVFYKNDTTGGMSGSPVYYNRSDNCSPCSMAIHAYGTYGSAPFSTNNHGTRINRSVFNNISNWK